MGLCHLSRVSPQQAAEEEVQVAPPRLGLGVLQRRGDLMKAGHQQHHVSPGSEPKGHRAAVRRMWFSSSLYRRDTIGAFGCHIQTLVLVLSVESMREDETR
ncbi:hypothetical protein GCM10022267_88030 [Lentzea roselyniae]|uniref:Uncharacterized protein n=1 Tax=Lentzea roselyniae TaxID=531940 RepID=A0ABP7CH40_9PSEU